MKTVGTITVIKNDQVALHSYRSPEDGELVCSQVIETPNKLVVVDTLLLRPYAQQLHKYVKGLHKPIDRVIITHTHPDHWFGLEFFDDVPIYALPETKAEIEQAGDMYLQFKRQQLGEFAHMIAPRKVVPSHLVQEGTEIIDGLKFVFTRVTGAETGVALLIELPDVQTVIAQDLVYNQVHVFFGETDFVKWPQVLQSLQTKGYTVVLPGHGEPMEAAALDRVIAYLRDAKEVLDSIPGKEQQIKQKLIEKYPGYRYPEMIDISNVYLYHRTW